MTEFELVVNVHVYFIMNVDIIKHCMYLVLMAIKIGQNYPPFYITLFGDNQSKLKCVLFHNHSFIKIGNILAVISFKSLITMAILMYKIVYIKKQEY